MSPAHADDFHGAVGSVNFADQRLDEFGADIQSHQILIILFASPGFDGRSRSGRSLAGSAQSALRRTCTSFFKFLKHMHYFTTSTPKEGMLSQACRAFLSRGLSW